MQCSNAILLKSSPAHAEDSRKNYLLSGYDFDDYNDPCVNDNDDGGEIDADDVGEAAGVEDNLGLNPQETLSLKHRGLQIIRCRSLQCSQGQCIVVCKTVIIHYEDRTAL